MKQLIGSAGSALTVDAPALPRKPLLDDVIIAAILLLLLILLLPLLQKSGTTKVLAA
jgi:hypothetical protein